MYWGAVNANSVELSFPTPFFVHWCLHGVLLNGITGDSYNRGEQIDGSKFGADPGLPAGTVSSNAEASPGIQAPPTCAFRCKKCRRVIALQENVLDHVPGEGESCFDWHKRRGGNPFRRPGDEECSSIFVEPLRWMKSGRMDDLSYLLQIYGYLISLGLSKTASIIIPSWTIKWIIDECFYNLPVEEGGLEGKLTCAHCEARLGYFNWSGIQCSCGSWITPAFQLHKSRVDISTI